MHKTHFEVSNHHDFLLKLGVGNLNLLVKLGTPYPYLYPPPEEMKKKQEKEKAQQPNTLSSLGLLVTKTTILFLSRETPHPLEVDSSR